MNFIIRDEQPGDAAAISAVTTAAFKTLPVASGTEAAIIGALRRAGALSISLVAIRDGELIGHVAFSPVQLGNLNDWFGLGPVAVRPDLHRSGVGTAMIRAGFARLRHIGARGCATVGDPDYYGRFGLVSLPELFCEGVPNENVLALSFGSDRAAGNLIFHPAFLADA